MSASPESADLLLKRLEWTVIRKLDGILQGDYRTLFRGFGLDLADLREYQAHDDVRHIDWNVTARTQVPHVRVYNEDREVTAWFLLDLSPSVDFGSGDTNKRQVLERVHGHRRAAPDPAGQQGRRCALSTGSTASSYRRAAGGSRCSTCSSASPGNPRLLHTPRTDISQFVGGAFSAIKRRSLVFVVSDFISNPGWDKALLALTRRHEVLAVRLVDPVDGDIPDVGMLQFEDAETGETVFVDTGDAGFRRRYTEVAEAQRADAARRLHRRRHGCARTVDRGRSRRCHPAVRGSEAHAAFGQFWRRHARASGPTEEMRAMIFLWPFMLWLLALLPVLVVLYILVLRRKKRGAVRFANLAMVKAAMGKSLRLASPCPAAPVPRCARGSHRRHGPARG